MNNPRLEARLLALGVCESIAYTTGRAQRPRVLATVAAYACGLAILAGAIALAAH